jgi:hypothetical protein
MRNRQARGFPPVPVRLYMSSHGAFARFAKSRLAGNPRPFGAPLSQKGAGDGRAPVLFAVGEKNFCEASAPRASAAKIVKHRLFGEFISPNRLSASASARKPTHASRMRRPKAVSSEFFRAHFVYRLGQGLVYARVIAHWQAL